MSMAIPMIFGFNLYHDYHDSRSDRSGRPQIRETSTAGFLSIFITVTHHVSFHLELSSIEQYFIINGWGCLFLLNSFFKSGLEAAKITLWASTCWSSSHTRVTSVKSLSSLKFPNAVLILSWKSFHCTMCILSSMFSFQPNKLRHILKVASW